MVQSSIKMTLTVLLTSFWLTAAAALPGPLSNILGSGDGLTPSTAFHANSAEEQYMVLRHLCIRPEVHALVMVEGAVYDVYITGSTKVYFTHPQASKPL